MTDNIVSLNAHKQFDPQMVAELEKLVQRVKDGTVVAAAYAYVDASNHVHTGSHWVSQGATLIGAMHLAAQDAMGLYTLQQV